MKGYLVISTGDLEKHQGHIAKNNKQPCLACHDFMLHLNDFPENTHKEGC